MSDTYYRDFRDGESHRFTTDLVDSQVPEYLQEEGPLLIKMIEEYYNFLHTGGNPESAAKNLIKLNDIDEVNDYYTQYLKDTGGNYTSSNTAWTTAGNTFVTSVYNLWRKQYLLNVPQTTESFELLVKNSLQLFRAKGSVQGFEALFRGIYGLDSEIKTPWNRTFKASEGDWNYDEYLQCNYTKDVEKFTGLRILGQSSGGSAIVQRVNKKLVNGRLVAQLVLSDIGAKPFEQNEIISTLEFPDIQVRVQTGIKEIVLSANGSDFTLGEIVNINGNGIEGRAIVNETDNFEGRLSFTLVTKGSGYRSNSLPRLIGGVGGSGGEYAIGSVEAPLTALNISQEQVGFLASNGQIQIGEANSFISNGQITQTELYANAPLAGPSVSNGLNISWSASSNTATLEDDVANNTFTNGSIWFLGNTTPGSDGDHTPAGSGMVVHDYDPGTSTITFTSQTTAAASTNTAVIRQYAANTVYIGTSNLASATYQSALEDVLDFDSFNVGAISFIATISTGRNYVEAPTAQPIDTEVYALRIQDGAGGFLGNNANVNVQLLANNVITRLSVLDHGFGYTNASAVTLTPDAVGGSTARGIIKLGGVARTEGGWTTTESFPSSNQRIHDSFRYQAFSYEVVTQESYVNYNRSFRAVSHPAGSEMFGVYQTQETGSIDLSTNSTIEIFDSEGGVEIANNSSLVLGANTTFGGSSTIVQGDKLNLGSLTFTVNSITSNTKILANNIHGVSNSQAYTTSPFSANVTLSGNLVLTNSSNTVTGLDTKFVRDLKSGYKLYFDDDSFIGTVQSIQGHTSLKLATSFTRNSNNQSNVYIVYPDQVVLTGNVTITADTKTITGNETLFQQEIKVGDVLLTQANVRIGTVNTITSNTSLVLSNTYTSAFPTITNQPGVRILFNRSTYQPYKMSGEISAVHNGRNITGIHSQFENELQRGDQLYYEANGLFIGMVNRIQSNTSANLVNTYYAPDGANLTDAVVLRRHKLSKLIEE